MLDLYKDHLALLQISNKRESNKNHARTSYHLHALGFILILQRKWSGCIDCSLHGTKDKINPYHNRPSIHHTFYHDILHHVQYYFHPKMAHLFNNQTTSPSRTTLSSRALSRGLHWDLCLNPQETNQDLGFKISFQPRLVHHYFYLILVSQY